MTIGCFLFTLTDGDLAAPIDFFPCGEAFITASAFAPPPGLRRFMGSTRIVNFRLIVTKGAFHMTIYCHTSEQNASG